MLIIILIPLLIRKIMINQWILRSFPMFPLDFRTKPVVFAPSFWLKHKGHVLRRCQSQGRRRVAWPWGFHKSWGYPKSSTWTVGTFVLKPMVTWESTILRDPTMGVPASCFGSIVYMSRWSLYYYHQREFCEFPQPLLSHGDFAMLIRLVSKTFLGVSLGVLGDASF